MTTARSRGAAARTTRHVALWTVTVAAAASIAGYAAVSGQDSMVMVASPTAVAKSAAVATAASAGFVPTAPGTVYSSDAARLLDQAAFGPTDAAVAALQQQGVAAWIDDQLATPATAYAPIDYIDANSAVGCPTGSPSTCGRDNYTPFPVQLQFYRHALTGPDQLRQRVALAYSQIFVISGIDIRPAYGVRNYQQMLLDNAFVNYRQLLERITLHPAMGDYLDMVNNNKPTSTVEANENYAREVLQLFSIGLSKLNPDGTTVNDANGVAMPSYDQTVVQGFARAFTGWTYAPLPNATSKWTNPVNYGADMVAFDAHHDTAAKTLLNGKTIPAGQTAAKDLSDALDAIVAHPNVGPFIGRQLIQALVTSNPTPAYVARIAAVFDDNGSGVRGDMKAVIRAILLDREARGENRDRRRVRQAARPGRVCGQRRARVRRDVRRRLSQRAGRRDGPVGVPAAVGVQLLHAGLRAARLGDARGAAVRRPQHGHVGRGAELRLHAAVLGERHRAGRDRGRIHRDADRPDAVRGAGGDAGCGHRPAGSLVDARHDAGRREVRDRDGHRGGLRQRSDGPRANGRVSRRDVPALPDQPVRKR